MDGAQAPPTHTQAAAHPTAPRIPSLRAAPSSSPRRGVARLALPNPTRTYAATIHPQQQPDQVLAAAAALPRGLSLPAHAPHPCSRPGSLTLQSCFYSTPGLLFRCCCLLPSTSCRCRCAPKVHFPQVTVHSRRRRPLLGVLRWRCSPPGLLLGATTFFDSDLHHSTASTIRTTKSKVVPGAAAAADAVVSPSCPSFLRLGPSTVPCSRSVTVLFRWCCPPVVL